MRIKWFGTASLLIEGGNTRILIDPYLKQYNPKLPRVSVGEAASADAAVITHPHLDHFRDIGAFLKAGLKTVYVSENGIAHARENGIPTERMVPLSAGETITIGEMTVTTYQSRHCVFDAATLLGIALSPRTYFHAKKAIALLKEMKRYKITDDIYALVISCGGKTVTVLGSAGMDENTVYPQGSDLLVFPYQGRARMYRYMVPFLKKFQPKAVFADHFDDAFPPLTHKINTKKFVTFAEREGVRAIVPKEGEWIGI